MTLQWRQVPTYETPLNMGDEEGKQRTVSAWYRYFQQRELGTPPAAENAVAPTASPFIYTAPRAGQLIVTGGTVGMISISRSGIFYQVGAQTSGAFYLGQGDQLRITYSAPPTLTWIPA